MFDYYYSRIEKGWFMTCKMLFEVTETYLEESYQKKVWEVLDIGKENWKKAKLRRSLSKRNLKKLCEVVGVKFTDDDQELSEQILKRYFEERGEA